MCRFTNVGLYTWSQYYRIRSKVGWPGFFAYRFQHPKYGFTNVAGRKALPTLLDLPRFCTCSSPLIVYLPCSSLIFLFYSVFELQNREVQLDSGFCVACLQIVIKDFGNKFAAFLHKRFLIGLVFHYRELFDFS